MDLNPVQKTTWTTKVQAAASRLKPTLPTRDDVKSALRSAAGKATGAVVAGAKWTGSKIAAGASGAENATTRFIADKLGIDQDTVRNILKAIPLGIVAYFTYAAVITAAIQAIILAGIIGIAYAAVAFRPDYVSSVEATIKADIAGSAAAAEVWRNSFPAEEKLEDQWFVSKLVKLWMTRRAASRAYNEAYYTTFNAEKAARLQRFKR